MKQLLDFLSEWWEEIKNKTWFVTFRGLFIGALFSQIQQTFSNGHMVFTITGVQHMFAVALFTAAVSLYHLYLPTPATTSAIASAKANAK